MQSLIAQSEGLLDQYGILSLTVVVLVQANQQKITVSLIKREMTELLATAPNEN